MIRFKLDNIMMVEGNISARIYISLLVEVRASWCRSVIYSSMKGAKDRESKLFHISSTYLVNVHAEVRKGRKLDSCSLLVFEKKKLSFEATETHKQLKFELWEMAELKVQGKVYLRPTLPWPHLWNCSGYVVVVVG